MRTAKSMSSLSFLNESEFPYISKGTEDAASPCGLSILSTHQSVDGSGAESPNKSPWLIDGM